MRSLLLTFAVLTGCGGEDQPRDSTESLTQPLGTAWLFELDGVSAGSVASLTSTSGGSPCNATSLRLSLGPNLSATARLWLESVLAHQQVAHNAAIYVGTTNQRVGFSVSAVQALELPRANSSDPALVYFSLTIATPKPATCTAVSASVMASKNQLAATWAGRYARANTIGVRFGTTTATAPFSLPVLSYRDIEFDKIKIEVGAAGHAAAEALAQRIIADGQCSEAEFTDVVVIPRDQLGAPLFGVRWYGPARVVAHPAGQLDLQIERAHLTAPLPDGGIQ